MTNARISESQLLTALLERLSILKTAMQESLKKKTLTHEERKNAEQNEVELKALHEQGKALLAEAPNTEKMIQGLEQLQTQMARLELSLESEAISDDNEATPSQSLSTSDDEGYNTEASDWFGEEDDISLKEEENRERLKLAEDNAKIAKLQAEAETKKAEATPGSPSPSSSASSKRAKINNPFARSKTDMAKVTARRQRHAASQSTPTISITINEKDYKFIDYNLKTFLRRAKVLAEELPLEKYSARENTQPLVNLAKDLLNKLQQYTAYRQKYHSSRKAYATLDEVKLCVKSLENALRVANKTEPDKQIAHFSEHAETITANNYDELQQQIQAKFKLFLETNHVQGTETRFESGGSPSTTPEFTGNARVTFDKINFNSATTIKTASAQFKRSDNAFVTQFQFFVDSEAARGPIAANQLQELPMSKHYSFAFRHSVPNEEILAWAIKQVNNHMSANPDPDAPFRIVGHLPQDYRKAVELYCNHKNINYHKQADKGELALFEKKLKNSPVLSELSAAFKTSDKTIKEDNRIVTKPSGGG